MRRHESNRAEQFRFFKVYFRDKSAKNRMRSHLLRFREAWCFHGGEGDSCILFGVLFLLFNSMVRRENGRKLYLFSIFLVREEDETDTLPMLSVFQNHPFGQAFFRRESWTPLAD